MGKYPSNLRLPNISHTVGNTCKVFTTDTQDIVPVTVLSGKEMNQEGSASAQTPRPRRRENGGIHIRQCDETSSIAPTTSSSVKETPTHARTWEQPPAEEILHQVDDLDNIDDSNYNKNTSRKNARVIPNGSLLHNPEIPDPVDLGKKI